LRDRSWQRGIASRYAAEWRHHFSHRLRIAAVFAHAAMRPRLLTHLLPLLEATRLLAHGAEWSGKVRCALNSTTTAWLARGASGAGSRNQPRIVTSSIGDGP
jgi:hypothetical protein